MPRYAAFTWSTEPRIAWICCFNSVKCNCWSWFLSGVQVDPISFFCSGSRACRRSFFCHFYFLCVSCSGKKGRESNLTVTVSSIAPPKLCFGHLRAGFLVPWNSSYLDLVELILIYVWIFKASILLLLMTPRPFIRLKTI